MKERPKAHTLLISEDAYRLLDREARRHEAETGGRVSRSRIAERCIRATLESKLQATAP